VTPHVAEKAFYRPIEDIFGWLKAVGMTACSDWAF
jgi:hypothetical protein